MRRIAPIFDLEHVGFVEVLQRDIWFLKGA